MNINRGKIVRPRRIFLYARKGWGKSTWANIPGGALFLNLEDGLADIDCDSTDWLQSYEAVVEAVRWLIDNPQPHGAIVVDTADWLERVTHKAVAEEAGKQAISEIGYAKGYDTAVDKIAHLVHGLDIIRHQGKHIIFLAHEQIVRFSAPGGDAYDRYTPALHKTTAAYFTELCDEVLYGTLRIFTKEEGSGFHKRKIGLGGSERYVRTTENAAIVAKNRLRGMPEEIGPTWDDYSQFLPQKPSNGDVSGIVVNGSSKQIPVTN